MADDKGKLDLTEEELIHRAGEVDETSLEDLDTEPMYINIGPTHPATHGAFRVFCKLDGERIEKAAEFLKQIDKNGEPYAAKDITFVTPHTGQVELIRDYIEEDDVFSAVDQFFHGLCWRQV